MMEPSRRGGLYLVAVKLLDVAARAGFVLVATYALPIAQAGQFGLLTTLVALFAFGFNFERHIDIQRRTAGQPYEVFDRYVSSATGFFAFNWALMTPLFLGAVILMADISPQMAALAAVIVIGEHISNQAYYFALISPRYAPLLLVVTIKNIGLAAVVLYQALLADSPLRLDFVLTLWAAGAALCTAALVVMWLRIRTATPREKPFHFGVDILGQHKASAVHFLLGLIALLVLQYDRLAVGALMSMDQVGVYFRHAALASLAYQAFSVISFNRIIPTVFAAARQDSVAALRGRVLREYLLTLIGAPVLFALLWGADVLTGGVYSERFHLSILLIGVMLVGFMLRAAADFHGLVLNARHLENAVLRQQAIAFAIGAVLLAVLTWRFGLFGAASATVATAGLYLILIATRVSRLIRSEATA
ncbi:lipopolysaccharide biosynthesis protein [Brevundimonas sp. GCM10030266]|uniref:lipopolysaccharide biosynthesis protein n=1 Tax=Brevundimonas sp. GCM10030266 TaxID=3273386 RepID=UPI0036231B82